MNRNQPSCPICQPTLKSNKRILTVIKKILIIFKSSLKKYDITPISEETKAKQNFFYRFVEYLMLGVDSYQQKPKRDKCQKHEKLKKMIAENIKISQEVLEQLSERMVSRILKGKFELSTVLHLSKNISRSRVFQRNKCQIIDKGQENGMLEREEEKREQKQKNDKVKGENATISQNSQQKQVLKRESTKSGFEDCQQSQRDGDNAKKEIGIMWNQWINQCQLNQMYYHQYYYCDRQ